MPPPLAAPPSTPAARRPRSRAPSDLPRRIRDACRALADALLAHPDNDGLRDRASAAALTAEDLWRQSIHQVYRLLFLFLAEDRGLLAPDAEHSTRRLRSLALADPPTDPSAETLWPALAEVFAALGPTPGARPSLALPRLAGWLWDPAATPDLNADAPPPRHAHLADADLLAIVRTLAVDGNPGSERPTDFARTPPSDLGFAYASLLTEHPTLDATGAHLTLAGTRNSRRRSHGVFYTPDTIARGLLETALEPVVRARLMLCTTPDERADALLRLRVCDPAAGSGQFLIAAADRLADHLAEARGQRTSRARLAALRDVVRHCIYAVDIDPFAAELCKVALWFACADPATPLDALDDHVKVANALLGAPPRSALALEAANDWCHAHEPADAPPARDEYATAPAAPRYFHWHLAFPEVFAVRPPADAGFDVVLGNPPFLNQLESATAHTRATASLLRARFDGVLSGYADTASAFLLLGAELLREGGRVALVQPQSVLGARDAAPVRRALLERTSLVSLWIGNDRVFEGANVFTCAPTLERAPGGRAPMRRFATAAFTELDPLELDRAELARAETWSHLAAGASGIPDPAYESHATLGDLAGATADFRDQYYGLEGFLLDDERGLALDASAYPPIITSGLIDLACTRWGARPTRIHKRAWQAPRVDRARMQRDGSLGPWITSRLVPKILVATQTRVIEAFVDAKGVCLPSTPVISVIPRDPRDLWRVAAALASPVCSALAMHRHAGTALSPDAIKLAARQVLALPLPLPADADADADAWQAAADLFRDAHHARTDPDRTALLLQMGQATCAAYRVPASSAEELMRWWGDRLTQPNRRATERGH